MKKILPFLALLPLAGLVYACGDDDGDSGVVTPIPDAGKKTFDAATEDVVVDAGPVTFAIPFEAKINGQPFSCASTYTNIGTKASTVKPQDLRFFASEVKLVRTGTAEAVPVTLAATEMQGGDIALMDFEDKTGGCAEGTTITNTVLTGTAPAGTYDGIELTIGLPAALNHGNPDQAPVPLLGSGLSWTWNFGYIFFALGLTPQAETGGGGPPPATPQTFFAHVGSTGCTGNATAGETVSCLNSNRMVVKLSAFDPATSKIVLDLEKLYTTSDLTVNGGGASGCMSAKNDPECPAVFEKLGLSLDSGASTGNPVIFSVAPR